MTVSVWAGRIPAVRGALTGALVTGTLVAGALAGGLLFAAPASADVTVTPAQAHRGDAAKLTFRVPDERPGAYTTKVELRLPESTPIAEVYPMSVPDWGPSTTTRPLDQALGGIHHGRVTDVTSTVTWVRTAPPASPGVAELVLSLGPMPEAEWLVFDVTQTYSDGTQVRWSTPPGQSAAGAGPAPVVALAAPPPATNGAGTFDAGSTAEGEQATDGFSNVLRVGLLIVLLVTAALGGAAIARRRQPAIPADPEPHTEPEHTEPEPTNEPDSSVEPEPDTEPTAAEPEPASGTRWRLRS